MQRQGCVAWRLEGRIIGGRSQAQRLLERAPKIGKLRKPIAEVRTSCRKSHPVSRIAPRIIV
jgi:hypothetical protein